MTMMFLPNGQTVMYDCNITEDNKNRALSYLTEIMNTHNRNKIDVFINSHRDADHMRGIKIIHAHYPIQKIWDSGVPGTTPDSQKYFDYMDLRRNIGYEEIKPHSRWTFGDVIIRIFNSKRKNGPDDANYHSIVIKAEYGKSSVILAGDTTADVWKDEIIPKYADVDFSTNILLASHHGSLGFFDDPRDEKNYFTEHIKKMAPDVTVISVRENDSLPHGKAIEIYEKYTSGVSGTKIYRTDKLGHIKFEMKLEGGGTISHRN
ncbi:Beta-lactamase superfamily domain protein [uncultured archaeon]|nr:Beta-lactamase superfamily domain protein [uncultured archaeon]